MQNFLSLTRVVKTMHLLCGRSVRRYHSGAPRHPRIRRNLCAHPLHLLVSSYVRLAYAEMRIAIEDEGTVHTRTGSQA